MGQGIGSGVNRLALSPGPDFIPLCFLFIFGGGVGYALRVGQTLVFCSAQEGERYSLPLPLSPWFFLARCWKRKRKLFCGIYLLHGGGRDMLRDGFGVGIRGAFFWRRRGRLEMVGPDWGEWRGKAPPSVRARVLTSPGFRGVFSFLSKTSYLFVVVFYILSRFFCFRDAYHLRASLPTHRLFPHDRRRNALFGFFSLSHAHSTTTTTTTTSPFFPFPSFSFLSPPILFTLDLRQGRGGAVRRRGSRHPHTHTHTHPMSRDGSM